MNYKEILESQISLLQAKQKAEINVSEICLIAMTIIQLTKESAALEMQAQPINRS
ncbi:MAG: hypothetical protein Q8936_06540 [Bacillota bacterium]|nr:hypothetical protein [Bacillota bacterium]